MKNILDYLERTTVCNAWKTAVDDGNICMTWLELQEMSKSIGTALCKRTGRQKPVVILAEKSAVTLAAMFGVVYAGCFYVMVDPNSRSKDYAKYFIHCYLKLSSYRQKMKRFWNKRVMENVNVC